MGAAGAEERAKKENESWKPVQRGLGDFLLEAVAGAGGVRDKG